jgi:hypothetical protein
MPLIGSTKELEEAERLLDPEKRYVDLAVRLRLLTEDASPGELLPDVIGGRWDTWTCTWVRPTPADLTFVEWTVQQQQLPIFLGLPTDMMLVAIFAGRQAGKSRVGLMEVGKDALRFPGMDSFVISLDFKASREPEETFRSLLDPAWGVKWRESDRAFIYPHGHRVLFRSAENISSCRGPSTKTVLLDEASRMSEDVFIAAVGGGAASVRFKLLIATTPLRESEWIRKVDAEWEGQPGSCVRRLKTVLNPRRNKRLLEHIKNNTPADLYRQEFEGLVVPPQNAVYAQLFNRALHLRSPGQLPEAAQLGDVGPCVDFTRAWTQREYGVEADFVGGWDFGKEAMVLGKVYREWRIVYVNRRKVRRYTERLWILGEAVDLNTTTDHHARLVVDKFGRSIAVVTDAMGARDKSDGRGLADSVAIDTLKEHGFASVEPVGKANPDVKHRVRTVNRALRSALDSDAWPATEQWPSGEVRLFIAPDTCPQLIDALESQKMVNGKPEKDGKHEHVLDALGYLVCAVLPIDVGIDDEDDEPRKKRS